MAVRRMSRSRTSLESLDEELTVGICWRGTIICCGIISVPGDGCGVNGGINGALPRSSHGRDIEGVGESKALVEMPLEGAVNGVPAEAAPIAPPGWKPRKTSAGLLPVALCSFRAVAIASASPNDRATVVEDVGAPTPNEDSSSS